VRTLRSWYKSLGQETNEHLNPPVKVPLCFEGRAHACGWNAKWHAAGFVSGSFRQPADPVLRLGLFRAYFRLHPEHENAPLEITAAQANSILAAIDTAQSLSDTSAALEATAIQERDEAVRKLRRRLSALRNELTLLLGVDDPRWYQFGFTRPADGRTPAPGHLLPC
jgi:hypothetical protein